MEIPRHLYLVMFLLLLPFAGTQAAERVSFTPSYVSIEAGNSEIRGHAFQDGQNALAASSVADALTARNSAAGQLRLPGIKSWRTASTFRYQPADSFYLLPYKDNLMYAQILSTRHMDGFYLYFLKKIIV